MEEMFKTSTQVLNSKRWGIRENRHNSVYTGEMLVMPPNNFHLRQINKYTETITIQSYGKAYRSSWPGAQML